MDIYKALAIKTLIEDFAYLQFKQNGITVEEAALIMDSVNAGFQKSALDAVIKSLIKEPQDTNQLDEIKAKLDEKVIEVNCQNISS